MHTKGNLPGLSKSAFQLLRNDEDHHPREIR
jgi:hypothetical protein